MLALFHGVTMVAVLAALVTSPVQAKASHGAGSWKRRRRAYAMCALIMTTKIASAVRCEDLAKIKIPTMSASTTKIDSGTCNEGA